MCHVKLAAALLAAALAASATARAQAPVPEDMPFDIPYGAPLSLQQAQQAIAASIAEAAKHHWKMAVAVVGPAGNLIAEATMDNTQYASIPIAQAKARTSALFRRPSGAFQTSINSGGNPANQTLIASVAGTVASEGGFPIVIDGKLVGALGAGGGIYSQDAVIAQAGVAALTGK